MFREEKSWEGDEIGSLRKSPGVIRRRELRFECWMDADALRFPTNFGAELTIAVMSLLQRPRSIANTGSKRECLSYYIMASENVF